MNNTLEALNWAFLYHFHTDCANAAVHCAPVRFSPITFRLYDAVIANLPEDEWSNEIHVVMTHYGNYEEDRGR